MIFLEVVLAAIVFSEQTFLNFCHYKNLHVLDCFLLPECKSSSNYNPSFANKESVVISPDSKPRNVEKYLGYLLSFAVLLSPAVYI